jgi:2'-5' RNA ligase
LEWKNEELISIINQAIKGDEIRFSLGAPVAREDYFYFPLERGYKEVESLHDVIYEMLPPKLLLKEYPYSPHITFGRLKAEHDVAAILREAQGILSNEAGIIQSVVLERIGEDDDSIIEYEKSFVTRVE